MRRSLLSRREALVALAGLGLASPGLALTQAQQPSPPPVEPGAEVDETPAVSAVVPRTPPPPVATLPVQGLGYTMRRLKLRKTLNVGYLGGYITMGRGASYPALTCWRAKTTDYLRATYPDATISEINATVGGAGSDLGAFRVSQDLLSKKPDIVFVEFVVNDAGLEETRALRCLEGVVRQIKKANRLTDIVFVYTVTRKMGEFYARGETPPSVERHRRIAAHYGIPEVNIGETLWKTVTDTHGGDFTRLVPDNIYPNDEGYAVYADALRTFLEAHRADVLPPVLPPLPAPLSERPLEQGRLIDAWTLPAAPGWLREEKPLADRFLHRLTAREPGAELVVPFVGDAVGLYWLVAPDSGDIEWTVDRGDWERCSSWDKFALRTPRAHYTVLTDSLKFGPHTLHVRVLDEKNPESTGTAIRLGALLVNGPALRVRKREP